MENKDNSQFLGSDLSPSHIDSKSDPIRQYTLGLAYLSGDGVEKNEEMAIEFLTLSAYAEYHEKTRYALEKLIKLYQFKGNSDVTIDLCNRLIEYLYATEGQDSKDALDYRVKVALCLDSKRKREEARTLLSDVYARKCELFGKGSPSAVRTFCAGLCLYFSSNYEDEFSDMLDKARQMLDEIKNIDDYDVMSALHNYADALSEFYGHSALGVYEEMREWVLKFRGAGSDDDLAILSDLCDVYYELEFYDEAIDAGKELYSFASDKYGEHDDYTLSVCENFAKVCYLNDNYDEALSRLDDLAKAYSDNDENRMKLIEFYYNAAVCYAKKTDNSAAKDKLSLAHGMCLKAGLENTDTGKEVKNLLCALNNGEAHVFLTTRWSNLWGIIR